MVVFQHRAIVGFPQRHSLKHSMWLSRPLQLCFLILVVHSEPFASALWKHHLAPVPPLSPISNVLLIHTFQPHWPSLCPSNTPCSSCLFWQKKECSVPDFHMAPFLSFKKLKCHPPRSLPCMPTHSCSSFPVNITYFYFHISTFHCLIVSCPVCVYYVDPP